MQSKNRAVMTVKHSLVVSAMRLSLLVWRVCLKGVIYLCLHSLQCCILVMLQCINDSSLVEQEAYCWPAYTASRATVLSVLRPQPYQPHTQTLVV